jgi:hypothetical protein
VLAMLIVQSIHLVSNFAAFLRFVIKLAESNKMTLPIMGSGSLCLSFFIVVLDPSSINFLAKNEPKFIKQADFFFSVIIANSYFQLMYLESACSNS